MQEEASTSAQSPPARSRKILVVAEKPSVAREVAAVLGAASKRRGYIEGPGHLVTWAVGHLIGIAEPEEQDPAWAGRWNLGSLPILPARFKLAVLKQTADQFEVVKSLMLRPDVAEVVNATDAGREGELIFRRIYLLAGCAAPIKRLWASDMTEEGLKKALSRLMDGDEKRSLGLAAFARAEADWLVGMNFSRLFTLKNPARDLVSVGRVQTPVLKLICDRRREIEHFVPKDFWTIEGGFAQPDGQGERFQATWFAPPDFDEKRVDDEARARAIADKCVGETGLVEGLESRQGSQKPPLPFDLTTLQREMNTRFGYSAKETLDIAQALYEKRKLITYPRTDSRYLTSELFAEILGPLRAVWPHVPEASGAAERVKAGGKFECVNDKKVTDHHAIVPTARAAAREQLSEREWNVYEAVARRLVAALLPAAKFANATLWVVVEGEKFKATGKVFKDIGWLAAEPWRAAQDNPLPKLKKGQGVTAESVEPVKRQTKAPAHFTDASLLAVMETAGKLVEDEELRQAMKDRGLGTPATRAQVIETLISRGFVEKDKKRLVATDKGLAVVDLVEPGLPEVVSPELTGEWERRLSAIERGQDTYQAFMQDIRAFVRGAVLELRARNLRVAAPRPAPAGIVEGGVAGRTLAGRRTDAASPAPDGPDAVRQQAPPGERAVSDPHGADASVNVAGAAVSDHDGPVRGVGPAPARGRSGDVTPAAALDTGTQGGPESAAAPRMPSREPLGVCPRCGGDVVEGSRGYGCLNFRPEDGGCSFVIWKELFGGEVDRDAAAQLLAKGRTFKRLRFRSKKGEPYKAFLKFKDGVLEPDFKD